MLLPLDGPSIENEIDVSTIVEIKVNALPFEERKVITFQPQDGKVRYGFTNSITSTQGFLVYKSQVVTIEASSTQSVYIVSLTGTVKVYISERA